MEDHFYVCHGCFKSLRFCLHFNLILKGQVSIWPFDRLYPNLMNSNLATVLSPNCHSDSNASGTWGIQNARVMVLTFFGPHAEYDCGTVLAPVPYSITIEAWGLKVIDFYNSLPNYGYLTDPLTFHDLGPFSHHFPWTCNGNKALHWMYLYTILAATGRGI